MDVVTMIATVLKEVGAGNAALVVMLGLFSWFFTRVLPDCAERIANALERMATSFATHDALTQDIQKRLMENQVRIDALARDMATKEDLRLLQGSLCEHSRDCKNQASQMTAAMLQK